MAQRIKWTMQFDDGDAYMSGRLGDLHVATIRWYAGNLWSVYIRVGDGWTPVKDWRGRVARYIGAKAAKAAARRALRREGLLP